MACDAQTLITTAYANGYAGLSDRDLKECILAAACLGGTGGGVAAGNGSPAGVIIPTTSGALYIQIDSLPPGQLWEWYSGAWH